MRPLNGARADPIPSIVAAEVRRLIGEGYPIAHIAKVTGVSRETLILTPGMNTAPERDLTSRLMGGPLAWEHRRGDRGKPGDGQALRTVGPPLEAPTSAF